MGTGTALPLFAMQGAAGAHAFEIVLELADARGDAAAVGFEFGFAGSAGADAAAQTGDCDALAREPRQQIFQLRQFDLQTAFARCVRGGRRYRGSTGCGR